MRSAGSGHSKRCSPVRRRRAQRFVLPILSPRASSGPPPSPFYCVRRRSHRGLVHVAGSNPGDNDALSAFAAASIKSGDISSEAKMSSTRRQAGHLRDVELLCVVCLYSGL